MKIDPLYGARIISFQYKDQEILATPATSPECYGSTFWPSPQSSWGWPPLKSIDSKTYTFTINSKKAIFESQKDSLLGVKVIKTFVPLVNSNEIKVIYEISNMTDSTIHLAPWEITRVVPQEGIVFFPESEEKFEGKNIFGEIKLTQKENCHFWEYNEKEIDDHKKSFLFSKEGWLAFAKKNLLLIKQFEDISKRQAAQNESEIELYANPSKQYIEIEQQGKYAKILPNESIRWSVVWSLHEMAEDANKMSAKELIKAVYKNR
ncbi:MAG: hypothetical protein SNJ77_00975 [Cytophagales bacterium]